MWVNCYSTCIFSSRRLHTRCALVTGVQTCAMPICRRDQIRYRRGQLRHRFKSNWQLFRTLASPLKLFLRLRGVGDQLIPVTVSLSETLDQRVEISGQRFFVIVLDRLSLRSEEHTSELQSLMRISYAVFFLTKKNN